MLPPFAARSRSRVGQRCAPGTHLWASKRVLQYFSKVLKGLYMVSVLLLVIDFLGHGHGHGHGHARERVLEAVSPSKIHDV